MKTIKYQITHAVIGTHKRGGGAERQRGGGEEERRRRTRLKSSNPNTEGPWVGNEKIEIRIKR